MIDLDELSMAMSDATSAHRLPAETASRAWHRGRRRRHLAAVGGAGATVVFGVTLTLLVTQARSEPPTELRVTAPPAAIESATPTPSPSPSIVASPVATSTFVSDAELEMAMWYSVRETNAVPPVQGHPDYSIWLNRDGTTHIGGADFNPAQSQGPTTYQVANSDALTWDQLSTVSTDPVTLRTRLGAGGRTDLIDKNGIQLLGTSPAPLALRQALIAVLSEGAIKTEGGADLLGRSAEKISIPADAAGNQGVAETLYVDTTHARLLEESSNYGATTYLAWGTDAPPTS